jgi:sulfur carrier protein ThiS adenylyltransferase
MNSFEQGLINYITAEKLKKIQSVKIGIAGAGGLGSNCAFNLVRSGFKNFMIVDFDLIEPSNLDRQFYFYDQIGKPKVEALGQNLKLINPDINITALVEKLDEKNIKNVFLDCDIVVEAFDRAECKKMMVEEYINSNKFLISASGLAGWGNSDAIKIHKIKEKFYIVGDLETGVSEDKPPISPRVNIAAAKQADVILTYVVESM